MPFSPDSAITKAFFPMHTNEALRQAFFVTIQAARPPAVGGLSLPHKIKIGRATLSSRDSIFLGESQGSTESHPSVDDIESIRHFSHMAGNAPYDDIGRKHPARGVHIYSGQPAIVFLTVCAEDRKAWLADSVVHEHLRAALQSAQTWLVGYYLLIKEC